MALAVVYGELPPDRYSDRTDVREFRSDACAATRRSEYANLDFSGWADEDTAAVDLSKL
jgi:hypothetical protein